MPQTTDIERVDDNLIKVSGCFDVTSVAQYKNAGIRLIDEAPSPVVDLSGVEVVGSAAIALLIAWQRHAFKLGKQISFINPPDNLLDIARACGVDHIVPFVAAS